MRHSIFLMNRICIFSMQTYSAYFINDLLSSSNIYFFLSNPPA